MHNLLEEFYDKNSGENKLVRVEFEINTVTKNLI